MGLGGTGERLMPTPAKLSILVFGGEKRITDDVVRRGGQNALTIVLLAIRTVAPGTSRTPPPCAR
jgi:hypothetical protein